MQPPFQNFTLNLRYYKEKVISKSNVNFQVCAENVFTCYVVNIVAYPVFKKAVAFCDHRVFVGFAEIKQFVMDRFEN